MKLDILAIAAHPDDVELASSGTVIKHLQLGYKVGILDLTQGELGTRGNAEIRSQESAVSSKILGIHYRQNLNLGDGFFEASEITLKAIIQQIRLTKPKVVLANAPADRHPDHGRASSLVSRACFLSGLPKIETFENGIPQKAHRPQSIYFYLQDRNIGPDFVVDISEQFDLKMQSIKAFKSQFYDPNSAEPMTPISGEEFFKFIEGRAMDYGRQIGVTYGEGFKIERPIGIDDLMNTR